MPLILKELPKKKQGIKHKEFPMENGSHYSPKDNQKIGFNSCLSLIKTKEVSVIDIKEIIGRVCTYPKHSKKVLDTELMEDIVQALIKYMEEC
jgi:hypothetical protein